jgi:hypothetical protein
MTENELEQALLPVADHYFGANLTVNTVLSAYLRAAGLHPSGQTWQMAKYALDEGGSFIDAVKMAGADDYTIDQERAVADPHPVQPSVDTLRTSVPTAVMTSPTRLVPPYVEPSPETPIDVYEAIPAGAMRTPAHPRPRLADLPDEATLDWFPKQFTVGDIDGEGATRLLGTPDLAPVSVLVRETAQNSWDARLRQSPTTTLRFTMNLRRLGSDELAVLRERVFTRDAGPIPVRSRLDSEDLWVLEISDRGAKGLGGPIRNDLAIPPGQATDFIDLVMNIGTPRDVNLGAGTYGFGKTISYTTSSLGTVLFWSRTPHQGQLQHRLIGSAFGRSFDDKGKRYTGRHWWGVTPDDSPRVEPLVGTAAQALAESLFATHFNGDDTGTSLLIIDPDLGGEDRRNDVRALVESTLWHLWPKLIPATEGQDQMRVSIQLNGAEVPLPDISTHPILFAFTQALDAVRAAQAGHDHRTLLPTHVVPIEMYRPARTLGHLAITRFPQVEWEAGAKEIVPLQEPVSSVALMRHDAELLVKYLELPKLDSPTMQWCAVFKPDTDTDDAFAMSEPPSHDDWVPEALKDKAQRQVVNMALKRVRQVVEDHLAPPSEETTHHSGVSVAALADSLAPLMGPVGGSAPGRRPAKPRTSRPRRPRIRIDQHLLGADRGGMRTVAVRGVLESAGQPALVTATVGIGVEGGGAVDDKALARPVGWSLDAPDVDSPPTQLPPDPPFLQPGEAAWFVAEVATDLVADLDLRPVLEAR